MSEEEYVDNLEKDLKAEREKVKKLEVEKENLSILLNRFSSEGNKALTSLPTYAQELLDRVNRYKSALKQISTITSDSVPANVMQDLAIKALRGEEEC